jgi:F-box and WD-40 domain protein CDC4
MEEGDYRIFATSRHSMSGSDLDRMHPRPSPLSSVSRPQEALATSHPRPLPTPTRTMVSPLQNLLPSAPASPPTPAPSPTPQIHRLPTWSTANENEDNFLRDARPHFSKLDSQERQRFLAEILNLCDSQQLSFVLNYVSPRLKKDPFKTLPNELCLRVWPHVVELKLKIELTQFLGAFVHR